MRRARLPFLSPFAALVVAALAGAALVSAPAATAATTPPVPTSVVQWGDQGVVYLSWTSGGGVTTGFNVYRSTSSTVPLTSPLNGSTPFGRWNYTDTFNLVGGTTYYYVVQAVSSDGGKSQAAVISSKPTASSTPTSTPTPTATPTSTPTPTATTTPVPGTPALSATSGNAAVSLAWTKGSGTVTSWSLYRSTSASGVVAAGNLRAGGIAAATLTYNDTTVTNGTTYYYVVVATNGGGSTSSNQVTGTPIAPTPTPTPTATGASKLQVINPEMAMSPNRFVMSRMSYEASPTSIVRMADPDNNDALTYFKFNDVSTVQLKNTGTTALSVTSLVISEPSYFTTTTTTPPFTIAAGATKDIPVRFVFLGGNIFGPDLREANLTISATGQAATVVQLAGLWQPGPNRYPGTTWDFEPSMADITAAFGWTTNIGGSGDLNSNNRTFAYGDEKLATTWKAADATKPVEMQQLAAYNSGGFAQVNWYKFSDAQGCAWQTQTSCKSIIYMADGSGTTTTYPRLTSGVLPRPSYDYKIHPFSPGTTPFGFQIAGEFSDDSRNSTQYDVEYHACAPVADCGHHLRFFPAKNAAGVIPNTWLVTVDQQGINNDFNDNVYVATNLAPVNARN